MGTYSNIPMLKEERECTPCDPGKFCASWNMTTVSGDCDPGYYCVSGSHTATPQLTNLTHCPATFSHLSIGGKCPSGNYCPVGSKSYHGEEVTRFLLIVSYNGLLQMTDLLLNR